ncbi:lycopene cyclase domain-containing protein [Sphingobacterium faecium]|uniref:lycopene cyclase domain-containing protein n=1 Tax=Sphingobacterium faecium TaxID=34087 RepID=UPI0012920962|nr:lycopene cyclase domain-containing protein [Sphingobacterium faecium]MQP27798.1 lycopene cyclase domain-containing protein [Sphingobacterium faecium]
MQAYTYILINFLTVIICFIFSFDRRIQFNKHFNAFFKGSILVAIPFIAWDIIFTKMGVWWFNLSYTMPFRVAGLPIEEWLFFICIPFSCVFTYFCLDKFFNLNWANRFNTIIVWFTVLVCVLVAIFFYQKIYPLVTVLITAATVIFLHYIAKATWIGKGSLVYLCLMPGFFMVNGVLTGTGLESPIVNYHADQILNIRMWTIPIEDAVYGYAQFMLNIYFFKRFQKQ